VDLGWTCPSLLFACSHFLRSEKMVSGICYSLNWIIFQICQNKLFHQWVLRPRKERRGSNLYGCCSSPCAPFWLPQRTLNSWCIGYFPSVLVCLCFFLPLIKTHWRGKCLFSKTSKSISIHLSTESQISAWMYMYRNFLSILW
jgi:hypothetical protein